MEGNYVVKELIETKRKKNGEVHIVYRTLLVEENTNTHTLVNRLLSTDYADKVIVITDNVVPFPNTPASFQQTQVDFVVEVEEIGDPSKIGG